MDGNSNNQFKSCIDSYLDRTTNGTNSLGDVVYSETDVSYTYLFRSYVFGIGKNEEFDLFD